jgi:uncharacterized coiled-coil protein SlyX
MDKILAAFITIGTLIGMLYAVDSVYLHQSEFVAFASAYSADKSESKVDALTQRQWKLDDRLDVLKDDGAKKNSVAIKALEEQKKELQEQIDREKAKLKILYEKK